MALLGNPDYRRRIGQANALPQSWPQVVPPPQSSFVPQPPIGAIPAQQPPQAPVGLLGGSPGPGGGPDPRNRSEDVVSSLEGWDAVKGLLGSALKAASFATPFGVATAAGMIGNAVMGGGFKSMPGPQQTLGPNAGSGRPQSPSDPASQATAPVGVHGAPGGVSANLGGQSGFGAPGNLGREVSPVGVPGAPGGVSANLGGQSGFPGPVGGQGQAGDGSEKG